MNKINFIQGSTDLLLDLSEDDKKIDIIKSKISDFKDEEFDELFKDNAFEWIFIEGKMYLKKL